MENLFQKIWEVLAIYGLRIIAALVILSLGRWLAKFIKSGISIPFPQRDVHVYKHSLDAGE